MGPVWHTRSSLAPPWSDLPVHYPIVFAGEQCVLHTALPSDPSHRAAIAMAVLKRFAEAYSPWATLEISPPLDVSRRAAYCRRCGSVAGQLSRPRCAPLFGGVGPPQYRQGLVLLPLLQARGNDKVVELDILAKDFVQRLEILQEGQYESVRGEAAEWAYLTGDVRSELLRRIQVWELERWPAVLRIEQRQRLL